MIEGDWLEHAASEYTFTQTLVRAESTGAVDAGASRCWTSEVPTDEGLAAGGSTDVDAMVTRVIDRASIPGRRGEPRLATQLEGVEQMAVATPHGRVAAWRVGRGPAVLLVHGWQDSARLWDPLMAELKACGQAFVALDLPGHGFSEGKRCLSNEVPDAVAAVAAATGPIDAAVAHSFACGGIALALSEGISVERLVLVAPALAYRRPSEAAGDATDAAHQRWRRIADELGFAPDIGDRALDVYLAGLTPSRARWNFTTGLADLELDLLIIASVDDERFDVDSARGFAAQLRNCELVELSGLDHRGSARDQSAVDAMAAFLQPT